MLNQLSRASDMLARTEGAVVYLLTVISGVGRAGSNVRHARPRSGGSGKCADGWDVRRRIRGDVGARWRHTGADVPACRYRLASWCLARSSQPPVFGPSTRFDRFTLTSRAALTRY
jgi:hypothetical protein